MRTDEGLLQEMSVLLRKSDFSIFEDCFFRSSSVSPIDLWIQCASPRVVIPADIRTEFGMDIY